MPSPEEKLQALLEDLQQLTDYLHGRGEKTLATSKRFAENAQKDPSNRDFDLSQARMLDYQHLIWHVVVNMVDKLLKEYS